MRKSGPALLIALALLLATPPALAQEARAQEALAQEARAQPAPATTSPTGCQPPAEEDQPPAEDPISLGTALPPELLDYLDPRKDSPFVQAYLLHHVAENGREDHWLVACAKTFIEAEISKPGSMDTLRDNRIPTPTLLRELRKVADRIRREEAILGQEGVELTTATESLLQNPDVAGVQTYLPYFEKFYVQFDDDDCSQGSLCALLKDLVEEMQDVLVADVEADAADTRLANLDQELEAMAGRLREAEAAVEQDSLRRTTAANPVDALTMAPDSTQQAVMEEATEQLKKSRTRRDSLQDAQQDLITRRDTLKKKLNEEQEDVADKLREIRETLETLSRRADDEKPDPVKLPNERTYTHYLLDTSPPAVPIAQGTGSGPAPNLLVGLADFVIARAKQELVLAYLDNVYSWMRQEGLVRAAFPYTYDLMRSLTRDTTAKHLSIGATGRIPLSVWRATLAKDFQRLPANLVEKAPPYLCGSDATCKARFRQLHVVAQVGYRLLDGEPTFDVLTQLAVIAAGSGITAGSGDTTSPQWARTLQALRILGQLAKTYRYQGFVPIGTVPYDYVLSAEAFSQASPKLRKAFVHTLAVRAVPPETPAPTTEDLDTFEAVLVQSMRTIETLWHTLAAQQGEELRPAVVVRATLNVVETATAIARSLEDEPPAGTWPETHWNALGDAVESMANQDYGLALAQTLALVETLAPQSMPQSVLALTGLAVGLAGAENAAQVQTAFEAAAAPVGGWQAKRFGESERLSITAYPGASVGYEHVIKDAVDNRGSSTLGTSLPIGLEYQLLGRATSPTRRSKCWPWGAFCSLGLYVPMLDLGALLSYRLEAKGSVEQEPNVTLRQVFAPGLYLTVGVGRSPVALLAGVQLMPSLREITVPDPEGGDREETASALRAGLSVVMDLVLFEL